MITHENLVDIDHTIFKTLGISEEQFLSLPEEYQHAFLYCDWQISNNHYLKSDFKNERENQQKRNALRKSEFEEKVKRKVLTFLKKK